MFETEADAAGAARVVLLQAVGSAFDGDDAAKASLRDCYDAAADRDDSWSAAFAARYYGAECEEETEAVPLFEESFDRFTAVGDRWNAAFSMYYLSGWYLGFGLFERGSVAAARARDLAGEIGDLVWHAHASRNLGLAAYLAGDHEEAKRHMSEALERLRLMGDDACTITLNGHLASVELAIGTPAIAVGHVTEAMRAAKRLGETVGGAVGLLRAARVAVAVGKMDEAVRLAAAAKRFLESKMQLLGPAVREEIEAMEASVAGAVGETALREVGEREADQSYVEAIDAALAWCLAFGGG